MSSRLGNRPFSRVKSCMISTFTDFGQVIDDFVALMYVQCPRCQRCAQVRRMPDDKKELLADTSDSDVRRSYQSSWSPRKLSCLHCSYTALWQGKIQHRGGPYDWYFGLPLWLQTPCCGEVLWAFNEEHIRFLEQYVTARQRVKFYVKSQMRNRTLASRLPAWMKSAKNRSEIIKELGRLRERLQEIQHGVSKNKVVI